jgi:subtilisin family serine protease
VIVADNHRYEVPDLVAPGEGVYSSVIGGGYEAWDGTSMATPVVSGVAALILEKYPKIRVTDLVEELLTTCKDLKQNADRQGKGLVQVKAAV